MLVKVRLWAGLLVVEQATLAELLGLQGYLL